LADGVAIVAGAEDSYVGEIVQFTIGPEPEDKMFGIVSELYLETVVVSILGNHTKMVAGDVLSSCGYEYRV